MAALFFIILLLLLLTYMSFFFLKKSEKPMSEGLLYIFYIISFFIFGIGLMIHGSDYDTAIDPIDSQCYSPLGGKQIFSMLFYFIVYQFSAYQVWQKGRKLPPLFLVGCLMFLGIGIVINVFLLIHISEHDTSSIGMYVSDGGAFWFTPTAVLSLIIGVMLIIKIIKEEKEKAIERVFKNNFLNTCNQLLSERFSVQVWSTILLFPFFIVITLILILFGQDYDSMVKVFTDTTTWGFSQKMHPPILDHKGHYLCTVSAKGSPKIVKPIYLGKRHGNVIIVNRQLQIANAFEELIADFSPKIHYFIRSNYDKYGYDLSKKIKTKTRSNITYILMKPLEWFFLICLYVSVEYPETKIKRQYMQY